VNWFKGISKWARAQLARVWPRPYRELTVTERLPRKLKRRVLYVVQEDGFEEQAAMICPCGCGAVLHMNLLPDERPCWKLTRHDDRTVSLAPSVWRQKDSIRISFSDTGGCSGAHRLTVLSLPADGYG
jgi:hypothetical protein